MGSLLWVAWLVLLVIVFVALVGGSMLLWWFEESLDGPEDGLAGGKHG